MNKNLAAEEFLEAIVAEMRAWLDVPGRDNDSQRNLVLGALQNLRLYLRDWPGERLD